MINEILMWAAPFLSGVSITGVLAGVIYLCLKSAFNKQLNKLDVESIIDKKVDKAVKTKIETVSFTHSIKPLCESELQKINEFANDYIKLTVAGLENKLDKVILIQEKQAKYFDNSIGVSQEAKDELKKVIEEAKIIHVEPVESIINEELPKEEKPVEIKKNKVSR